MDNKTILIVDDEEDICGTLAVFLSKHGFRTIVALSGEEGWRLFQEYAPAVTVTDYKMPGMNGMDLLRKIKDYNSRAQVLFISGNADMRVAITAIKEHAFDFIPKPLDLDYLLQKIREAERREEQAERSRHTWHGESLSHELIDPDEGVSMLRLNKNLDDIDGPSINKEAQKYLLEGVIEQNVVVSLAGVNYINNVGLNILVELHRMMTAKHHRTVFIEMQTPIQSYLQTLGYHEVFKTAPSLEGAVRYLTIEAPLNTRS